MLKIKDNVDLKELEKFGFELIENCYDYDGTKSIAKDCYIKSNQRGNFNCRCMSIEIGFIKEIKEPIYDLNTLFDLIQAGLVEKIEE